MSAATIDRGVSIALGLVWSRSVGTATPPMRLWVVFTKGGRPKRWEPDHIETNKTALRVSLEEFTAGKQAFVVREFRAVPVKRSVAKKRKGVRRGT